jgi:arabinose-5-phosphate isomerase
VLTTGAGTSGIIARKIAATLTSTGTPSLFLHPSDALHGGLGVVQSDDVVIAISNSGETGEILVTLPYLRHRDVALIALVGNTSSTLAHAADAVLDAGVKNEAGPLNLAPTSSTTVALAVGDALAMSVLATSPFTPEAFARNHPAGRLGRRLTLRVEDVMIGPLPRPCVDSTATLLDAIGEIGAGGVGAVLVVDADGVLRGIITDGDVRRALQAGVTDPATTMAVDVMTKRPISIEPGTLAYQALQEMEDRPSQISVIPIVDRATGQCTGLVRVHDLVRAGI